MLRSASAFLITFLLATATNLFAGPLGLQLPTDNTAIFSDDPSQFYMYTDRTFEGETSQPWTGGKYGFSRNQKRTSIGIVYTRLHEGIDIRPVHRDSSGNPLDEVRSIANGTVVYVNANSSHSNYGRYIVIVHDWGYGPFFSLYAHLDSAVAKAGQQVAAGQPIAKMGFTGAGINRTRAHVHVELNFLLSDRFQKWYDLHFTSPNHHGIFNGFNLTGMDIAELFLAHRSNPGISIPEFLARTEEPYYRVAVPKTGGDLPFLRRYPWLGRDLNHSLGAKSWEITFARTGVPLEIRPGKLNLQYPAVVWVKPSGTDHSYLTMGRITGSGDQAKLTPTGSRYIQLLTDSF